MDETEMQHGRNWSGEDPTGWLASEKLNGCRAYWDGTTLWSRSGRRINLPAALALQLPGMHLDGELWAGRNKADFTKAVNAVKYDRFCPSLQFMVFDAPEVAGTWDRRLACAASMLNGNFGKAVECVRINSPFHLRQLYRSIKARGGEGLMLIHPMQHRYHRCRTPALLKLKRFPGNLLQYLLAA